MKQNQLQSLSQQHPLSLHIEMVVPILHSYSKLQKLFLCWDFTLYNPSLHL